MTESAGLADGEREGCARCGTDIGPHGWLHVFSGSQSRSPPLLCRRHPKSCVLSPGLFFHCHNTKLVKILSNFTSSGEHITPVYINQCTIHNFTVYHEYRPHKEIGAAAKDNSVNGPRHRAGYIFPEWCARIFITFNALFSQFTRIHHPLLILGLVAPAIIEIGNRAGRCCSSLLRWRMLRLCLPACLVCHRGSILPFADIARQRYGRIRRH